eukprot:TRINITY_DN9449_c0_g1_i1.p1 TRINITY_DN9449_c0_g1~~TRINITY_DN9449_c0_g1_i1.p1  ORF type:complete len:115 (+),score=7.75 TRINITY_DN9449_c0_g1_i1:84-428(+)
MTGAYAAVARYQEVNEVDEWMNASKLMADPKVSMYRSTSQHNSADSLTPATVCISVHCLNVCVHSPTASHSQQCSIGNRGSAHLQYSEAARACTHHRVLYRQARQCPPPTAVLN